MLSNERLVGFVATAGPSESLEFYENTLGLQLLENSPFALVFAAGSTTIRVQKVQSVVRSGYTALGWQVSNITRTVEELAGRGVKFQRYEGMNQKRSWHMAHSGRFAGCLVQRSRWKHVIHHRAGGSMTPNPSIERTCPGKPGHASHLKRWASEALRVERT